MTFAPFAIPVPLLRPACDPCHCLLASSAESPSSRGSALLLRRLRSSGTAPALPTGNGRPYRACLFGIARKGIGPESRIPSLPGKASHLERGSVGLASIGSSTSDEAVYRHLILEPLPALGLNMKDIDKYAPELHNPEIMQFAGSGDVVKKNYRMIAAMAVLSGLIEKAEMPDFLKRIGMVGFAPTQGHISVPYLGHAAQAMQDGSIRLAMILCKASLFLNRITELCDGVSFVLERNPGVS